MSREETVYFKAGMLCYVLKEIFYCKADMLCYILIEVDYCISQPCINNGSCAAGFNSYSCSCQLGYTGLYCEQGKRYQFMSDLNITVPNVV